MNRLSIITVNLNNSSGLRKTIESVVSQTYKDIEYLVIDGGSTDGSVEVIKEFSDKINYWISEPDNGIYQAMNKAIVKATGDYCQFLNSGDTLVGPDVTTNMLKDMSDCSILIGNMLKPLSSGKVYRDKGIESSKPTFLTFYCGTLNHSSAYIRRSLFEKYGLYDETLKIVSDWKWYLITVGINNESILYRDIDLSCFDMSGISCTNFLLLQQERRKVLKEIVPAGILADYDKFLADGDKIMRLKRHRFVLCFLYLIERILFKMEKWKLIKAN